MGVETNREKSPPSLAVTNLIVTGFAQADGYNFHRYSFHRYTFSKGTVQGKQVPQGFDSKKRPNSNNGGR